MITFKQFLQEDPLHDTALQMAIRKELDIDQRLAGEVLIWLRDGTVASDEDETDIFNALAGRFDDQLRKQNVQSHDADEMLQLWMTKLLKTRYKLRLDESAEQTGTLLTNIIANLLKKDEKVFAYAKVWDKDPKKHNAKLHPVSKIVDNRVHLQVSPNVTTWFELYGADNSEAADDLMFFKKEGGYWVLAEKGRKPIIA